jgi:hypothetical protein
MVVYLKLNGVELECTGQEKWIGLLDRLPDGGAGALGVSVRGRTESLDAPVEEYAFARTLTFADEEGRRIYERSLQFVFLTAAQRLLPGKRVRIRHSFVQGLYIDLPEVDVTETIVAALKADMKGLVAANLPIQRFTVSTEHAKAYFTRTGQIDRLRILAYRRFDHFTMYRIDGLEDYFYGEMVPATGCLDVFDLMAYGGGILLQMPDINDPRRVARFVDLPHLLHTYSEAAKWHAILNCENVADLNEMVANRRLREFIRVNEALQERKIQQIADQFEKMRQKQLKAIDSMMKKNDEVAERASRVIDFVGTGVTGYATRFAATTFLHDLNGNGIIQAAQEKRDKASQSNAELMEQRRAVERTDMAAQWRRIRQGKAQDESDKAVGELLKKIHEAENKLDEWKNSLTDTERMKNLRVIMAKYEDAVKSGAMSEEARKVAVEAIADMLGKEKEKEIQKFG